MAHGIHHLREHKLWCGESGALKSRAAVGICTGLPKDLAAQGEALESPEKQPGGHLEPVLAKENEE